MYKTVAMFTNFPVFQTCHLAALLKARLIFDKIILAVDLTKSKDSQQNSFELFELQKQMNRSISGVDVRGFSDSPAEFIKRLKINVIVEGLDGTLSLEQIRRNQHINEDQNMQVPIFYVIPDQKFPPASLSFAEEWNGDT